MDQTIPVNILIADDDPEDRYLAINALEQNKVLNNLFTVENGEELMDFLFHKGKYADSKSSPTPDIILLDLNMPKKTGMEALQEIRKDDRLKHIPVVILTTSKEEEDILRTYKLGVNSFITKPVTFEGLVDVMKALKLYWLQIVKLPHNSASGVNCYTASCYCYGYTRINC